MFYYAYLNEDDICVQIYEMPAQISGSQFIAIASNDPTLVGQHFNRTTSEFETVYYYAILDDRGIVSSTTYSTTQQTATATLIQITFAQYQTVTGLYWNGTEFVEPPISVAAIASTDEVNYKNQEKWLSTKLDEMDSDIDEAFTDISALETSVSTLTTAVSDASESISDLNTALNTVAEGKANASHTHAMSDVTGLESAISSLTSDVTSDISALETAVNGKAKE